MIELIPTKINMDRITLEYDEDGIRYNSYIRIKKGKKFLFSKVNSLNSKSFTISNPGVENLVDWKFYPILDNQNIIYNPIILGHHISNFGSCINNEQIFSLKKPSPRKKALKTQFFLTHNESLDKDFVFLGAQIVNNLKPIVELQMNNSQHYTFLNLTRTGNLTGLRTIKLLEKFNLHKKNIFLEISDSSDIDTVLEYVNFIKDGLNSNTLIIINSSEWDDQQLYELVWALGKNPKLIIFAEGQEDRSIKKYCSVIVGETIE
jgi:hypothetical protein